MTIVKEIKLCRNCYTPMMKGEDGFYRCNQCPYDESVKTRKYQNNMIKVGKPQHY